MLECVVNISEGRDSAFLSALQGLLSAHLLDVHSDPDHNRSVFTLVGEQAPRTLARECVTRLSLAGHQGVHPRVGVVDVVPFVPLAGSDMIDALRARDEFAAWIAAELGVPAFLYGPERTLPDIRRQAWHGLAPDHGPHVPHHTAGAVCVGARNTLVAYNVWLAGVDLVATKAIAARVRSAGIRAIGLQTGDHTQVSMNLVDPLECGPVAAYDSVSAESSAVGARIVRAELVGLVPRDVLSSVPQGRWEELDLSADRTIEARLAALSR